VLVEALKATNPPPGLATLWSRSNPQPAMRRHSGHRRPAARLDHTDRLAPVASISTRPGAQRSRAITAILSLIVVAAGYVYGYDTTLMALERSADEATSFVGRRRGQPTSGARAPSASSGCGL